MTEAIDEIVIQQLKEYQGKQLVSVAKEGLELSDDWEENKKCEGQVRETLQNREVQQVEKVVVSNCLVD